MSSGSFGADEAASATLHVDEFVRSAGDEPSLDVPERQGNGEQLQFGQMRSGKLGIVEPGHGVGMADTAHTMVMIGIKVAMTLPLLQVRVSLNRERLFLCQQIEADQANGKITVPPQVAVPDGLTGVAAVVIMMVGGDRVKKQTTRILRLFLDGLTIACGDDQCCDGTLTQTFFYIAELNAS